MQFKLSTAALAALIPFIIPAQGAPASSSADVESTSVSLDLAAATNAPAVPVDGPFPEAAADTAANSRGRANVHNRCNFPVYIYVCGQGHGSTPPSCTTEKKIGPHGTFFETYIPFTDDGRSIKIGRRPGEVAKPILQLEYTVNSANNGVAFDLSEVNGNPFGPYGFTLTDSRGLNKHCPPPGTNCPGVFYTPPNGHVYNVGIGDSIGTTLCG